jgi:hypothetical protein
MKLIKKASQSLVCSIERISILADWAALFYV